MEEARNAAREELAKLGKPVVEIDVQNYGKIVLELDADTAPVSVANFVGLIQDGFYDG
ncbi:MAG: peptidylprolyl isomerase, partial [Lachnospiraceae bacterium]|nr:peptidylprolyl isomerase [Lachnospiraceae bacterium]